MNALAKYETARAALAECHRIDEARDIADKAQALQVYARQAKNLELERWVAEIRLRARRRIGELSAQLEKAQGARTELRSTDETKLSALTAAGISKAEAHRCEKIAAVPEVRFENYISAQTAAGRAVTADQVVGAVQRGGGRTDQPPKRPPPKKLSKAAAERLAALDSMESRFVSTLYMYASQALKHVNAQEALLDEERDVLWRLRAAIDRALVVEAVSA